MIDRKTVRLAYYEASDGPRLMLFGPLEVDLGLLQSCFRTLSNGEEAIDLDRAAFIYASNQVRLRLQSTGRLYGTNATRKAQGIRRVPSERCSFVWSRTREGWDYLAELINGLIKLESSAHQYFTRYPDEDCIVVVSKGEYGDEVLDA